MDNSFYSEGACGKLLNTPQTLKWRVVQIDRLWQKSLLDIKESIGETKFSTWFKNTELVSTDKGIATIAVSNTYTKNWLESKHRRDIVEALQKQKSDIQNVQFKIRKNINLERLPIEIEPKSTGAKRAQNTPNSNLRKEYTFDAFIVGNNNSLAYAVAQEVAANPGVRHNPLFIYGGVGLGKTHLAQAIGKQYLEKNPQGKIVYVSCETFTNDFINAIATKKMNEFKKNYREVDVLIVDDVQFLSSKEGSQEEFFHTFNSLQQRSRQIILTADKIPHAIPALEGRLASRFGGGMVVDVQPPNLETRMAILTEKCREKDFALPETAIEYIARNIPSNIRELEGALNRLMIHCQFNQLTPSLQTAEEALKDMVSSSNRVVGTAEIIAAVGKYFGISKDDLLGKSRKKELSTPRQITIFLIRENTNRSLPEIGKLMGGKDHTTIMYSEKKIRDLLKTDIAVKSDIEKIRENLFSTLNM